MSRNLYHPIDHLPNELLCCIFEIYVIDYRCPPVPLLLVCSRWNAVALRTSSLWARIRLTSRGPLFRSDKIQCSNSKQLAKAIERTHSTQFQLIFQARVWGEGIEGVFLRIAQVDPTWLSRCKSLHLRQSPNNLWLRGFSQAHWKSLTTLVISAVVNLYISSRLSITAFFQKLGEESLQLQNITCMSSRIATELMSYPVILRRLKFIRLTFRYDLPTDTQWNVLLKLEELILRMEQEHRLPYTVKLPSLQRCSLDGVCYTSLPISILRHLKTLSIKGHQIRPPDDIVDLPVLENLMLAAVDWAMARFFNAPALLRLELRAYGTILENRDGSFASIWLDCHTSSPLKSRILDLELSDFQELTLIGSVFQKYMQSLEVLHLIFYDSGTRKPPSLEPLAEALIPFRTSTIINRNFCPILTVLSSKLSSDIDQLKNEVEGWMNKVKEGRRNVGLSIDVNITYRGRFGYY